jgi:hypothetical protein
LGQEHKQLPFKYGSSLFEIWRSKWIPTDYYEPSDKASKSKEKNNEIFHFIFALVRLDSNNQRMKQNLNNKWNSRLMNTWGM